MLRESIHQNLQSHEMAENGVSEENGEFCIEAAPESLYTALLKFSQAVSKVCDMRYFKREMLASLFEELLAEFIQAKLQRFNPRNPLPKAFWIAEWLFQWRFESLFPFLSQTVPINPNRNRLNPYI